MDMSLSNPGLAATLSAYFFGGPTPPSEDKSNDVSNKKRSAPTQVDLPVVDPLMSSLYDPLASFPPQPEFKKARILGNHHQNYVYSNPAALFVQSIPEPVASAPPAPPVIAAATRGRPRTMSGQPAVEHRKRKNVEHAKKSREKKKHLFENLQDEYRDLQQENEGLRSLIKDKIPEHAAAIIGQHCYRNPLPSHLTATAGPTRQASTNVFGRSDFELIENLTKEKQSFVLTDPRLPDNPIVYASNSFLELTGYQRDQVIGRNCRFLQGPRTDPEALAAIRQGIETGSDVTVRLLNFKEDGTPFWNHFFLAALHDRDNHIVNYVGVQCQVEDENEDNKIPNVNAETTEQSSLPGAPQQRLPPSFPAGEPSAEAPMLHKQLSSSNPLKDTNPLPVTSDTFAEQHDLDWAVLAQVLEADDTSEVAFSDMDDDSVVGPYPDDDDSMDDGKPEGDDSMDESKPEADDSVDESKPEATKDKIQATLVAKSESGIDRTSAIPSTPRTFINQTIKSELIHALLDSDGDVANPRFTQALNLLSSLYRSSGQDGALTPILHGSWRSLSRPNYSGCLGQNENNEFVYTLGKMAFNMFKPGSLRCTVQRTITSIEPVCEMDKALRTAPFSLRRELAMSNPETALATPSTMLKSYDINVAMTIEPSDFKAKPNEEIPAPPCRIRALQVVTGYFLPDPITPNRLTVWFTGGTLSPVPPPSDEFGGLEEWKQLFGAEHKRSWGESFSVMGAKVLFGAELPKGMDQSGAMSYALHRPYGGHGKAYADILYLDEDLMITKGNYGTVHVMSCAL